MAACFTQLVESCIQSKSLTQAKKIHQHFLRHHLLHRDNPTLLEKLTKLYVACNEVELARRVFNTIPKPSVVSWDLMIRAYAWNGPVEQAIDFYYKMLESGVKPTKFSFPFVLKACSGLQSVEDGKRVHDHAKQLGLESDVYVSTALLDMYCKCCDLINALEVFDRMPCRDVVAWNAMVAGFSLHGMYNHAIRLFLDMQKTGGLRPNASTIVALLPVLAHENELRDGKALHGYCVRMRFDENDVVVRTSILDMYAKCKCIVYARKIFDMMGLYNEVTCTAMIGGYVMSDMMRDAVKIFNQMNVRILSSVTLGIILRGCAKFNDLNGGRCLHGYGIKTCFVLHLMVSNTLLSLYAKCGIIDDVIRHFDEMNVKDTVSYSAIISGCVQNGNAEEAFGFFHKMQSSGIKPDSVTMLGVLPACSQLAALHYGFCCHSYSIICGFTVDTPICNALIDMYSKCGNISIAREVFDRMHKRDTVSWNAIIFGYGIHGLGNEALLLFHNMQVTGLKPDDVTFLCLLSACSHSGLVEEGKRWFSAMSQDFDVNPRIDHFICMTDLLGRAGLLDEAHDFIKNMPLEPDICVWGALLAASRVHGNIEFGDEVSKKIESLGPEGTGNCVQLSNIYSAAGRWDDAAHVRIMQKEQGFKKSPGCSWVEINRGVHVFLGGDQTHLQSGQINKELYELLVQMEKMGHHAESSFL